MLETCIMHQIPYAIIVKRVDNVAMLTASTRCAFSVNIVNLRHTTRNSGGRGVIADRHSRRLKKSDRVGFLCWSSIFETWGSTGEMLAFWKHGG